MNKTITKVWTFASDSNPNIEYETLLYADGSTSCSCKGWTRRVATDGSRSCKHTRFVDMGTADQHCTATHSYTSPHKSTPEIKSQKFALPRLGDRKFAL